MELTVTGIRNSFKASGEKRDLGLKIPGNITMHTDICYGPYGKENLLDIYHKNDVKSKQKTIISIHGGAWVYGDKELYKFYCMDLAERDFTVVNFNYRLAPENKYPAAIHDINAVFTWILKHASEYMIDLNNLFVVGDSAGAQLASQYLALLTNKDYQKLFNLKFPDEIKIKGAALNCGIYNTRDYANVFSSNELLNAYLGENLSKETIESLDTIKYITKDFPPTIVMTSYHDFLRDHARPMYHILKSFNIICEYKIYGSEDDKTIGHVFHLNIRLNEAKKCNDYECEFFTLLTL